MRRRPVDFENHHLDFVAELRDLGRMNVLLVQSISTRAQPPMPDSISTNAP
jgi:hypothetical protein